MGFTQDLNSEGKSMNGEEIKEKTRMRELSPIDIYKLLPKTGCRVCGEENCLAFAAKLANRETTLETCPHS